MTNFPKVPTKSKPQKNKNPPNSTKTPANPQAHTQKIPPQAHHKNFLLVILMNFVILSAAKYP